MGLGTKIKDALAGEPHESTYGESKPPGAFPEDGTGRHTDGRQVVPPHGSAVHGTGKTGTTGLKGSTTTYNQQRYEPGTGTGTHGHHDREAVGTTATSTGAPVHGSELRQNKLHKVDNPRSFEDSREYGRSNDNYIDSSRERASYEPGHNHHDSAVDLNPTHEKGHPYWGDVENGQGRHHGATRGVAGGAGAASAEYGANTLGEGGLPERTRHGHNTHDNRVGSKIDELHPTGEAVGGGVYNTVTGTGSPEQAVHHTGRHGQANHSGPESRTTGTTGGVGASTQGYSDTRYDPKNGTRDTIPTSRDDRTAPGVVGAGASIGAGLAASDLSRKHHEKDMAEYNTPPNHHGRDSHQPGMPHSSMLEPYPAKDTPHTSAHGSTGPGSSMLGNTANTDMHQSRFGTETGTGPGHMTQSASEASRFDDAPRSGMGLNGGASKFDNGRHSNMPVGETSDLAGGYQAKRGPVGDNSRLGHGNGSGMGSTSGAPNESSVGSGLGKNHFGPAHEGAKVMHTCHSCGADNDISHYFKKDAVYRIGS